jgi:hypothetical protein
MRSRLWANLLVFVAACSGRSSGAGQGAVRSDAGNAAPDATDTSGRLGALDGALLVSPDARPLPSSCPNPPNVDGDQDGFTGLSGDCDDCDPNVNPGAYDVPGNGIDEDCDGVADDEPTGCDTGLAVDSSDPVAAAKSLGICRNQQGQSWGLVGAAWVFPDGTKTSLPPVQGCPAGLGPNPLSHSLLSTYGARLVPRQGASMVAISSGMARAGVVPVPAPGLGTSPDHGSMCTKSAYPSGFPQPPPACSGVKPTATEIFDAMALELTIKVPTNASGLSFDFDFNTPEYPQFVCDVYNDEFVAFLWSGAPTPADRNISFDSMGNPVSVNNAFLEVCSPAMPNGKTFTCPLGTRELEGTGILEDAGASPAEQFVRGGATSWLTTRADVLRGETVTLRFAIWDAGDDYLDSTTLIDNLVWTLSGGKAPFAPPMTMRSPIQ